MNVHPTPDHMGICGLAHGSQYNLADPGAVKYGCNACFRVFVQCLIPQIVDSVVYRIEGKNGAHKLCY